MTDVNVFGLSWVPGGIDGLLRAFFFFAIKVFFFGGELVLWGDVGWTHFLDLVRLPGAIRCKHFVELAKPLNLLCSQIGRKFTERLLTKSDSTRTLCHFRFFGMNHPGASQISDNASI